MGFFNIIITLCVGAVVLFGAALTYKHRMAEQRAEMAANPLAAVMNPPVKGSGLAPLPKWGGKNWKGLVHKPAGQSQNASVSAPKQNAVR